MKARYIAHHGDDDNFVDEDVQSYRDKYSDLSEFVKDVKVTFSRFYNRMHNRKGTLRAANTLMQLGNLYREMDRPEEAVAYYRQAADIRGLLGDAAREGAARGNLADTLFNLKRFDEARPEIDRAIQSKKPHGHAARPWMTWSVLHRLEHAVGDQAAAARARAAAVSTFLTFRRAGGENHEPAGRPCATFADALHAGKTDEIQRRLAELTEPSWASLIGVLRAILSGSRDPGVADDPALDYMEAAEVTLLLEKLQ